MRSPVDECISTVTALYQAGEMAVTECMCAECVEELSLCFEDPACYAIFDCAVRTGCVDVECYQPNTCMSIIDAVGLGSPSVAMARRIGTCSDAAGCPRNTPLQ